MSNLDNGSFRPRLCISKMKEVENLESLVKFQNSGIIYTKLNLTGVCAI